MASLSGKWRLVSTNNLDAYLTAIHSPEEFKTKMLKLIDEVQNDPDTIVLDIHVDTMHNTTQLTTYIKGEVKHDFGPVQLGAEVQQTGADGRPSKIKVTIESDTEILVHKTGPGYESTTRAVLTSGTEMTMTLTCGGVTSTEIYTRLSIL